MSIRFAIPMFLNSLLLTVAAHAAQYRVESVSRDTLTGQLSIPSSASSQAAQIWRAVPRHVLRDNLTGQIRAPGSVATRLDNIARTAKYVR